MKNKDAVQGHYESSPLIKKADRLYVELFNRESNTSEFLVICAFNEKEDEQEAGKKYNDENNTFTQQRIINGRVFLKLKVDEGYMITCYYYPVEFFTIKSIRIKD